MLCVGVDQRSANLASIHLICTSLLETNRLGTQLIVCDFNASVIKTDESDATWVPRIQFELLLFRFLSQIN